MSEKEMPILQDAAILNYLETFAEQVETNKEVDGINNCDENSSDTEEPVIPGTKCHVDKDGLVSFESSELKDRANLNEVKVQPANSEPDQFEKITAP